MARDDDGPSNDGGHAHLTSYHAPGPSKAHLVRRDVQACVATKPDAICSHVELISPAQHISSS
jgi:hypothetical protein